MRGNQHRVQKHQLYVPRPTAREPLLGQGLLTVEDSQSHSRLSVRLLRTGDQPDAEASIRKHTTETSMPPAGFEIAIPASERPKIRALDRAGTGISHQL